MNLTETASATVEVAVKAGRQAHWLILATALFFLAFDFGLADTYPAIQAEITAIAKLMLRSYLGYWAAVWFLGHLEKDGTDNGLECVARAIIIAGFVLAPRG